MPTNLYGPGDNYHPENSHVIPALLRRFHEAKAADAPTVVEWGSGTPRRECLEGDERAEDRGQGKKLAREEEEGPETHPTTPKNKPV